MSSGHQTPGLSRAQIFRAETCQTSASDNTRGTMKLLITVLALVSLASSAMGNFSCEGIKGPKVKSYQGEERDVFLPCKYYAVRNQRCGRYRINITPGNEWFADKYQFQTLWVNVLDRITSKYYQGRLSVKVIIKGSQGHELFNHKHGSLNYGEIFKKSEVNEATKTVTVRSKHNEFEIQATPWDPTNPTYETSTWKFICHSEDLENTYGEAGSSSWQMCGGSDDELSIRANALGFDDEYKRNVVYYDTFIHQDVTQTDGRCKKAVNTFSNHCGNETHRVKVMNQCADILYNTASTTCVNQYSCHPMDVFNDCLTWGCIHDFQEFVPKDSNTEGVKNSGTGKEIKRGSHKGEARPTSCEDLHKVLYFCPEISGSGNITEFVSNTRCYMKFMPVEQEEGEKKKGKKRGKRN